MRRKGFVEGIMVRGPPSPLPHAVHVQDAAAVPRVTAELGPGTAPGGSHTLVSGDKLCCTAGARHKKTNKKRKKAKSKKFHDGRDTSNFLRSRGHRARKGFAAALNKFTLAKQ